jgi:hypothetical protein
MAPAATLLEAANLAPQNLRVLWEADTLEAGMVTFWQTVSPSFDEQTPNDRPVGAWLAIIASFSPTILPFADNSMGTITTFELAVDYIYRLCKFGFYYDLISVQQKADILAAYNAEFA